jgi:Ca2+-binding RTX toxin-like protein
MAIASPTFFSATKTDHIDGLISGAYWQLGPDRTISWGLGDFGYTWTTTGLQVMQEAFNAWEAVIDVDFEYIGYVDDYRKSTEVFIQPIDIMLSLHDNTFFNSSSIAGRGLFPNTEFADRIVASEGNNTISYPQPEGDITFNIEHPVFDMSNLGSNAFHIVLHEIGHALGLKHPHDGGLAGYTTYQDAGLSNLDDGFLTLMSYDPTSSIWEYGWASTPLPLDIIAAQTIYGANTTTHAGNTTHSLLDDGLLRTVYDVSGTDTLDASNIDKGITLRLAQGNSTTVDTLSTVYIAVNTVIENAIGTFFNDTIYGEKGDNTLQGWSGNDLIFGGLGDDLIFGQDGNDELQGGLGDDNLQGGDGADLMAGQDGNDRLFGQNGNDQLQGGAGLDIFKGGSGNDTLYGGSGIDQAYFTSNRSNFTQSTVGEVTTFIDNLGFEGTDQLTSIERAYFTDYYVNLTVKNESAVSNIASSDLQQLQELYVAFFNRVPDADGLEYWIGQFNSGQSINQIAESFYNSGIAFSELTGISAGMTNTSFINVVYNNVLGRSSGADPEGLSFWTSALQSGAETKATLVASIITSAHQFKGDAQWGWVADLLDNKVEVANLFSVEYGLNNLTSAESISNGMAIAAAVTPTDTTAAIELIGIGSTPIEFI